MSITLQAIVLKAAVVAAAVDSLDIWEWEKFALELHVRSCRISVVAGDST